jgi:ribosomal protein S8E
MKLRLFTAGTHNGLSFSDKDVEAIYQYTEMGAGRIPFVIGHPQNDLPIVGWLPKKALKLYGENGKKTIGFERSDAEFSTESLDVLKKLKRDKISVRLASGAITHIGLVTKAAVLENNEQTFSANDKTGVLCFSDDFVLEEKQAETPSWFKAFTDFFTQHKMAHMAEKDKEQQAEIDALKAKIADFEKKEKAATENAEIAALKKQISDFEAKEKNALKAELKSKIDSLKLVETEAKAKMDFGSSLIDSSAELAAKWIADLKPATVAATVTQGSVTDEKTEHFFEKKDLHAAALAAATKQFQLQNVKTA